MTTRPLLWSLRRELWENRSLWAVPLLVTGLVLLGSLFALFDLPEAMRDLPPADPARLHAREGQPCSMAPAPIRLASFLVAFFYSLDALYGERRDRSILFWKSLPVSDRTTVLAKALVPLAVLPLIAFVLSVAAVVVLLLLGTVILSVNGVSPATLWREVRFLEEPPIMLYGLTVHALWFAPIYGWLLLVSAWARRAPLLWAVIPPFAIAAVERIALGTKGFASLLGVRLSGAMTAAFDLGSREGEVEPLERLSQLDPLGFVTTPGLWLGLAFAAACLAAAVHLRRRRAPT
jgi:ABC-2 type transport system permease protein